jgi:hypothetical protein
MSQEKSSAIYLGFLTAQETSQGWVGGLLVTSRTGRPLEFQCTTPVKATKTQEILFGPTLLPYIRGELLAKTLIQRVNVKAQLLFVEHPDLLDVRQHTNSPVICLQAPWHSNESFDELQFAPGYESDAEQLRKMIKELPSHADLSEPLRRVQEALTETVRAGAVA